jgi:L-ascorbate metabolism protein UlaG (beta-lactamase superfamily)
MTRLGGPLVSHLADAARALACAAALCGCAIAPQPKTGPYHPSDAPLSVTRIVHGSYLLDFAGTRLLVDPWYYPRGVFNQREPLGLTFRTLPTIDGILITHGHGDHLDPRALEVLARTPVPVVVAEGLASTVAATGHPDVRALEWGGTTEVGGVEIHAVPADHTTVENGYVCRRGEVTVYAAGDTRYFDGLRDIARRFPRVDVALLPIGGLRVFGFRTEMDPEEAARATALLQPLRVIPTHYGLTAPPPLYWTRRDPVAAFRRELARTGGAPGQLVVLLPGESWHYFPP